MKVWCETVIGLVDKYRPISIRCWLVCHLSSQHHVCCSKGYYSWADWCARWPISIRCADWRSRWPVSVVWLKFLIICRNCSQLTALPNVSRIIGWILAALFIQWIPSTLQKNVSFSVFVLAFTVVYDILKDQNAFTFIVNTPVGHLGPQDLWSFGMSVIKNQMIQCHISEDLIDS